MAVNFTKKNKKSVNFQYKSQDDISLSTTIAGDDVDVTIARPDIFDDSKTSVSDAPTLESITADANLRYVASETPSRPFRPFQPPYIYSSGDSARYWKNLGSDEDMDLIQPIDYDLVSGIPLASTFHCPTFDIGGTNNPFSKGAFKCAFDATDTGYKFEEAQKNPGLLWRSENILSHKYFRFGSYLDALAGQTEANSEYKTFSAGAGGDFTIYFVYSMNRPGGIVAGYTSPLWGKLTGKGIELPDGTVVEQFYEDCISYTITENPDFTIYEFTMFDPQRKVTSPSYFITHDFDQVVEPATPLTDADGSVQIFVLTYNSSNENHSFFDSDARTVVNEGKSIGNVDGLKTGTNAQTVGAPDRKAYAIDGNVSDIYNPAANGNEIYIAEFGYFDKALEGQTAAALARLLRQKYQIS